MKGLELSERYFYEVALPLLEKEWCDKLMRMSFGLVGEGSDCFGFDDEISQDHDWGAGFCIWLTTLDYQNFGDELSQFYHSLPNEYLGFPARHQSEYGHNRVGVMEINSFYKTFLGIDGLPKSSRQWLFIPETGIATAVNGKVFQDPQGTFSAIRRGLLRYYPEDVRKKKIAARIMLAGQAGQYNYPRSLQRGEECSAQLALARFTEAALSLVFLVNRSYMPFYKWCHRAVSTLPILGEYTYTCCRALMTDGEQQEKIRTIEDFSQALIIALQEQQLTDSNSDFLPDHGPVIQSSIKDEELRSLGLTVG